MTKLSFLILGLTLLFYNNTFNNRAKDKSCEVEIIAVGDNLIHNSVLNSGKIIKIEVNLGLKKYLKKTQFNIFFISKRFRLKP